MRGRGGGVGGGKRGRKKKRDGESRVRAIKSKREQELIEK
jgi:hypothetical protein